MTLEFSSSYLTPDVSIVVLRLFRWIEACVEETLPPTVELEESLRNGVALGKLAHFMAPELVPLRKVYDKDLARYNVSDLGGL